MNINDHDVNMKTAYLKLNQQVRILTYFKLFVFSASWVIVFIAIHLFRL